MAYVNYLVWKYVDNCRHAEGGFGFGKVISVEVCMAVKMVAWFGDPQEQVDGAQSRVCLGVFIVNSMRRGMADEDVQCPPVMDAIEQEAGEQAHYTEPGFALCVLVDSVRPVADGASKAADQKFFVPRQFEVQVGGAFGSSQLVARIIFRVMVAWHVEHRNVQDSEQVFQVGIGEVAATEDQVHIFKVAAGCEGIDAVNHLVAYGKNFHGAFILPQNPIPCKCRSFLINFMRLRYKCRSFLINFMRLRYKCRSFLINFMRLRYKCRLPLQNCNLMSICISLNCTL